MADPRATVSPPPRRSLALNFLPLFALFVIYGLSGYAIYGWRKAKGQQTSVISTSTDEPDERGLHK